MVAQGIVFPVYFIVFIQLVTKNPLEACLFQVRIFRQQVAVGSVGVGALGGADHLQVFDLHRIVPGLGLNYEDYPLLGRWRDLKSCSIRSCRNILIKD